MLGREEERGDTKAKIQQLQSKIKKHDKEYHMKPFHTKGTLGTNNSCRSKRKRDGDDGGQGAGGGAGSTDCAELRSHGYEVEPQVIVDESGFVIESFIKVRQPFSTCAPR
jgi:hypothetical protein